MKYIIIINVLAFALFGMDKRFAQKGNWRIPEKLLFITSIFSGAAGAIVGMYFFHHKTLHKSFKYGLPLILSSILHLQFGIVFLPSNCYNICIRSLFLHSLKWNVCPYFDLLRSSPSLHLKRHLSILIGVFYFTENRKE